VGTDSSDANAEASDEVLMTRVKQGDQVAFSNLLARHAGSIHQYLYRLCQNSADTEDLLQETFLRLWRNAEQWQPGRVQLTTWLHRIARNLSIDNFRASTRRPQTDLRVTPVLDPESPELPQDQLLMQQRRHLELAECIAQLPERQRSALLLCQYQGMTNRQAAEVLDVSVDALESLLARARRRLRVLLQPHMQSEPQAGISPGVEAGMSDPPEKSDER